MNLTASLPKGADHPTIGHTSCEAFDHHLQAMLLHIDGYQHRIGGSRTELGHGRSVSEALSRQLHFRDLLGGHAPSLQRRDT